jgi:hypothetical protein
MNKKKLAKLRRDLKQLRAGKYNIKPRDLISLAKRLGRRLDNRGKHPMYVSDLFPSARAISIPGHPTINSYTAEQILDDLELDLVKLEELHEQEEAEENEHPKRLPETTLRKDSDPT